MLFSSHASPTLKGKVPQIRANLSGKQDACAPPQRTDVPGTSVEITVEGWC